MAGVVCWVSPGYLTSFSDSVRGAAASSMSSVWLFKQNAVRRMRGHRADGYEGEGRASGRRGQRSGWGGGESSPRPLTSRAILNSSTAVDGTFSPMFPSASVSVSKKSPAYVCYLRPAVQENTVLSFI